jgi:hypothetical protein
MGGAPAGAGAAGRRREGPGKAEGCTGRRSRDVIPPFFGRPIRPACSVHAMTSPGVVVAC